LAQKGEFARQCADLHINDYVTSQVDRHHSNIFTEFFDDGCRVMGIDNDFCLVPRIPRASGICIGFGPEEYPPYISREMCRAIMALNRDHLCDAMRYAGRNPDVEPFLSEINNAWERVEGLKAMAQRREKKHRVLEQPEDWASEEVLAAMTEKNSYYGKFLPEILKEKKLV
jgi:hypothetical protein